MQLQQAGAVIAHRGGSWDGVVENSMAAFRRAFAERVDGIEFDVHRTLDGALVIHHYDAIRAADGTLVSIAATRRADLPLLADGSTLPLLDDVFALRQRHVVASAGTYRPLLDVELKAAGYERETVDAIARHGLERGDVVVTSFVPGAIARVHELAPTLATGLLVDKVRPPRPAADIVAEATRAGASLIAPHHKIVNPALRQASFGAGLPIVPWTVNRAKDMVGFLKEPNSGGVITDFPLALRS
jgi:glycerophosphoryl diester phosphodiesterase